MSLNVTGETKNSAYDRSVAILLVGAMLTAAGCSPGMDQIDRRLAKVIAQSSTRTGLETDPRIRPAGDIPHSSASLYDTSPPTDNPPASQLSFSELDRGEPGTPQVVEGLNARLRSYALSAGGIGAADVMKLSLADALKLAQRQGREYLTAEESYIIDAISLLTEQHRWGPRLFADSSVGVGASGDEGRFDNALSVVNTLRATKQLPYGGQAEAKWVWNATEQLRSSVSGQYEQASSLVLDANIPLLRGAGMVAREDLIQAERSLVYSARDFEGFRRDYFVSIAQDYFQLIQSVNQLQNRVANLHSLEKYVEREQAHLDAERISPFELNQAKNDLLNSRSSLASAREQYILQVDRFKVRLGVPMEQPLQIMGAEIQIPEPQVTVEQATDAALSHRLDLQNQKDQYLDSERGVRNARDQLLPDLDLSGQVSIPTDPAAREGGFALDPDETSWQAGLTLSLPLDRRIERLQLRQALIRLQQSKRDLDQFTDNVVLEARRRVREIELARFRLEIAQSQVKINQLRQREQELKEDTTEVRDRLQTENDLLNSLNARDQALTDLRVAVLNYLNATGQLRVSPDGFLEPLPGMTIHIEDKPIDFEALFNDELTNADAYGQMGQGDTNAPQDAADQQPPDQQQAPGDQESPGGL